MLAIVNANIFPIVGDQIPRGTILVDDGVIADMGPEVTIPDDAEVIDAGGRVVTPGIVEAHGHVGISEQGLGSEGADHNESTEPVMPQVRAIDGINPGDDAFRELREAGITTVLVPPGSSNVIGGSATVIKCAGSVVDQMVVLDPAGMKVALGENPKGAFGKRQGKAPATRMGSAALLREALTTASEYLEKRERAEREEGEDPPRFDAKCEAMIPVLRGDIPLRIHCHRADDIATAVRIGQEYGLDYTLEHVTEGQYVVDLLAKYQVRCAVGPTLQHGSKVENRERDFRAPLALIEAGVPMCFTTDHPVIAGQYLPITAGIAVSWGMDYDVALGAITIASARHAGVEDRVGSLECGKDADLVIWSGDPLDYTTFADLTMIDGRIVYEREV
ncbi:MAG: amidohydrolase [Bacillota bacterium]